MTPLIQEVRNLFAYHIFRLNVSIRGIRYTYFWKWTAKILESYFPFRFWAFFISDMLFHIGLPNFILASLPRISANWNDNYTRYNFQALTNIYGKFTTLVIAHNYVFIDFKQMVDFMFADWNCWLFSLSKINLIWTPAEW